MTTVTQFAQKPRRNVELVLCVGAVAIVLWLLAFALAFHLVLRWRASYADPLMLPIITLLNGLGLVMIHRIDLANGKSISDGVALRQLMWTGPVAVVIAAAVLVVLRDHRVLRRYTYTRAWSVSSCSCCRSCPSSARRSTAPGSGSASARCPSSPARSPRSRWPSSSPATSSRPATPSRSPGARCSG
jgi:hypothetical protein